MVSTCLDLGGCSGQDVGMARARAGILTDTTKDRHYGGGGGGGWGSEGKRKKMTWKGGGNKANKGRDRLWVDNT